MFELILENAAGDKINFAQNSAFTISEIEGLNPPSATINTSEIALMDGAKFNSSKLNMRSINVAFAIEYDAAKKRIEVFNVLKSKQWVKMSYIGEYRQVFIEGYIESIDISYFQMKQMVTCSILCPSPYFKEAQMVVNELLNIINKFHFPFASTEEPELIMSSINNETGISVINDGDVECGLIIEMYCRYAVTNPKIFNYLTQEFFGIEYSLQQGDLVTIDTRQGQKTVKLLRSGVETNIFNYIMQGSTWLQLSANGDTFVYEVATGYASDLTLTFNHYNLYEGV